MSALLSLMPETSRLPSAMKARERTVPLKPSILRTSRPVAASSKRMFAPGREDAVAIKRSSGVKATGPGIGPAPRKGSYGIDAPYLLPVLGVLLVVNVVNGVISGSVWPFVGAVAILACAGCGLYTSRRGKFVVWAELLDELQLRGIEFILD